MSATFNISGAPLGADATAANIIKGKVIGGITGTANPVVYLTEAQYQALATKDADTLYVIS